MDKVAIKLIRYYQYFSKTIVRYGVIPILFPSDCKFYSTCSDYTIETIDKHGFWKGLFLGILRVLKCNPLTARN